MERQGLYYRFSCRCRLNNNTVFRLRIECGKTQESLGILVPVGAGFGLDTKIPVKRIVEGSPEFRLVPKQDHITGLCVPVYPEEPFAYISRLKEAYLVKMGKNPEIAIM